MGFDVKLGGPVSPVDCPDNWKQKTHQKMSESYPDDGISKDGSVQSYFETKFF